MAMHIVTFLYLSKREAHLHVLSIWVETNQYYCLLHYFLSKPLGCLGQLSTSKEEDDRISFVLIQSGDSAAPDEGTE